MSLKRPTDRRMGTVSNDRTFMRPPSRIGSCGVLERFAERSIELAYRT